MPITIPAPAAAAAAPSGMSCIPNTFILTF